MSDKEEADNSNSCTETGESDDSLSDLRINSQNHIQPFMFELQHGSSSEESHSSEEQGDNNESEDVDAAWLRVGNREWCGCGNCLEMSTEQEINFCQEMDVLGDNLEVRFSDAFLVGFAVDPSQNAQ